MSEDAKPAAVKAAKVTPVPVATGMKTVTAEQDLRVVTDTFEVFCLEAGVPRELNQTLAFAAQGAAAKAQVNIEMK